MNNQNQNNENTKVKKRGRKRNLAAPVLLDAVKDQLQVLCDSPDVKSEKGRNPLTLSYDHQDDKTEQNELNFIPNTFNQTNPFSGVATPKTLQAEGFENQDNAPEFDDKLQESINYDLSNTTNKNQDMNKNQMTPGKISGGSNQTRNGCVPGVLDDSRSQIEAS